MIKNKYTPELYIENQVAFFKAQSTKTPKLMGMEFEHFLIDKNTLRSYDYFEKDGQKEMLEALIKQDWKLLLEENGNVLGVVKNGHTITLEPGGQVEFSLKPYDTVPQIDAAYQEVLLDVKKVLKENQMLVSLGYHPKTRISELSLLPKGRYGMMYDYFINNGEFCHNMMKGTAATQVSIDYSDEEDFIKKFRVINFLSPVFARLFDSTPIFEGVIAKGENCRVKIWEQTDIKRSKLIPDSLNHLFGFKDYANYLLSLPPILMMMDHEVVFTDNVILKELIGKYEFTTEELEHFQSMVFPDVRLKKYLEIRMPDAMPYPYNLSVASIVKGILYNSDNLEKFYSKSLNYDDEWVKAQNRLLVSNDQINENSEIEALKYEVMQSAIAVLDEDESIYIKHLREVILKDGSLTSRLKKLYEEQPDVFLETICVAKK